MACSPTLSAHRERHPGLHSLLRDEICRGETERRAWARGHILTINHECRIGAATAPSISLDFRGRDPDRLGESAKGLPVRFLCFLTFNARDGLGRDSGEIASGKLAASWRLSVGAKAGQGAARGSDNFDWRDLRDLGKLPGWPFLVPGPKQGAPDEPVAASAARRVRRVDA